MHLLFNQIFSFNFGVNDVTNWLESCYFIATFYYFFVSLGDVKAQSLINNWQFRRKFSDHWMLKNSKISSKTKKASKSKFKACRSCFKRTTRMMTMEKKCPKSIFFRWEKSSLRNFRFLTNREFLDNSILSLLLEQVRKFKLRC